MLNLERQTVTCPYCWAGFEAEVDCYGGDDQDYYEDCPICCNPVHLRVHVDSEGNLLGMEAMREDEV